jgi:hypothetical protein
MISPHGFETPLNPDNVFVVRGQVLCALLDGLARMPNPAAIFKASGGVSARALLEASRLAEAVFGADIWTRLGSSNVTAFWEMATKAQLPRLNSVRQIEDLRRNLEWCPDLLFDTINLPSVQITGLAMRGEQAGPPPKEDVSLLFHTVAPGNATRRFHATRVFWRPPNDGPAPWFEEDDYAGGEYSKLWDTRGDLLAQLPRDAHEILGNVDLEVFRPRHVKLQLLGEVSKNDWQGQLDYVAAQTPSIGPAKQPKNTINHDSQSQLRGSVLISANAALGRALPTGQFLGRWATATMFAGRTVNDTDAGLTAARVFWAADCDLKFSKHDRENESLVHVFTNPKTKAPLLHGYCVETEGVQLRLNTERFQAFIDQTYTELTSNHAHAGDLKHYRAQFARFLIESRATSQGFNAYQARRGADLFVSAAGDAGLRAQLNEVLKRWDGAALARVFEATREKLLAHHPMYSRRRVQKTSEALAGKGVQALVRDAFREVADPELFKRYLESCVLNALTLRFKQLVALVGQGDESRLLAHVRLPIQFEERSDPTITVCESGAKGDGTLRTVESNWDQILSHFCNGFISECPNADEDLLLRKFWQRSELHEDWRNRDPRSSQDLRLVLKGIDPHFSASQMPSRLMRVLFEDQEVSGRQISLYAMASEIEQVRDALQGEFGRQPSDWELASRAVLEAQSKPASSLGDLLGAYTELDGMDEASLSPEARLADQVYRLSAPLCLDGCRACVHQSSDMMSDSMVEASVSRRLLAAFLQ